MNMKVELFILLVFVSVNSAWVTPAESQYHIQTDEGPERYFRYQTDSGQYRKERRLADGTIIGTEGWVDNVGYFRVKDYIADKNGFRILKSKTVFVGKGHPMNEVLRVANSVYSQPEWVPEPFSSRIKDYSTQSVPAVTYIPSIPQPKKPSYSYYIPPPVTKEVLCITPRPYITPEIKLHSQLPSAQLLPPLSYSSYPQKF